MMQRFSLVLPLLAGGLGAAPLAAQADAAYEKGLVETRFRPDTAEVTAAAEAFLTAFSNLEWEASVPRSPIGDGLPALRRDLEERRS